METYTPVMRQYLETKEQYKDSILLFRMGDFYELFFDDATEGSRILQITLTTRDRNKDNPIPMCGFPYHAAELYVRKLLEAGRKVAICEQFEENEGGRKVVRREVLKVLTPGTALEFESSPENIFLLSLSLHSDRWGLFAFDLPTGEAFATGAQEAPPYTSLGQEVENYNPRELLLSTDAASLWAPQEESLSCHPLITPLQPWTFNADKGRLFLQESFHLSALREMDISQNETVLAAAGSMAHYLSQVRKGSLPEGKELRFYTRKDHMILDSLTQRTLELFKESRTGEKEGSLFWVLDQTVTPMGARRLKEWLLRPLFNTSLINARLDAVEESTKKTRLREELREELKGIYDLDRLSTKLSSETASPRDLAALASSFHSLPSLSSRAEQAESLLLKSSLQEVDPLEDLREKIERALADSPPLIFTDGGVFREGYNQELDELRHLAHSGKEEISRLEEEERERTQISSLRVGFNKIFGFYIEISKASLKNRTLPTDYFRKQTLVNAERFVSQKLREFEETVLGAEEKIKKLEHRLFLELRSELKVHNGRILKSAQALASLDALLSLANAAVRNKYKRPIVVEGDVLEIVQGRHPIVERLNPHPFVPNDAYLESNREQIIILTGPNMGGKSTFLRQTALIVLMAQMGSFVPADAAKVGLIDRIFTRIGASDYLASGQSTFMVEMVETANILQNATSSSLVLLDEIGRGTSTYDGMAIAWSLLEYLHSNGKFRPKTLFATHYHQLTVLDEYLSRIVNYHISVKKGSSGITFLYRILEGPSDQSFGVDVAKLAGLPSDVVKRARELLLSMEKEDWLSQRKKRQEGRNGPTLFAPPAREIAPQVREVWPSEASELLEGIDVNSTTPMKALELLQKLLEIYSRSRE